MEEKSYGQRDIPDIIINFQGHSYNLKSYYQKFTCIHKTNKRSKWIIKVTVLPEYLRESLFERYVDVTIKEIHRMVETNEDIEYTYNLYKPKIKIIEYQKCTIDEPVSYKIIITGRILEKKEIQI